MTITQEFRELSAAGECVCDFDVACVVHPSTSCGACEYACHCDRHNYRHAECECSRCICPVKDTGYHVRDCHAGDICPVTR